jgi:Zinc carboxypeptidase
MTDPTDEPGDESRVSEAADERHPFGRRRFLQGSAAVAATALPIVRIGAAKAGAGCDPFATTPSFMGTVPDPESVLGFAIGVDQEIAAADAGTYIDAVAGASGRVRAGKVGDSVQGRAIRYAIVGRAANISNPGLEAIRQAHLEIRDPSTPRARAYHLAKTTPLFVWIQANVHGSEESGADAALQLLYELADRDDCVIDTVLDNAVVFLIPVQNPDGRVADERRNAYGFDLNRDFFARTQVETEDRVELMRTYPPTLLLDHHEFGYYRSFFPPNNDPIHHELGEHVTHQIANLFGPAMARLYRRNDWPFFNGGVYDFFAPQFNDTGTSFGFNSTGMTIEVYNGAPMSARFVRQLSIQWANLWAATTHRRKLLRDVHDAYVLAVQEGKAGVREPNRRYFSPDLQSRSKVPNAPLRHYFVLEHDRNRAEVQLLVRRLQRMDVKVYRLDEPLRVPDFHELAGGTNARVLPRGTVWIPMAQAQKHWIQTLMAEQPYLPTYYTYGLYGWSNPFCMNVDAGSSGARLSPVASRLPLQPVPPAPTLPAGAPAVGLYAMSFGGFGLESFGSTRWLFDNVWDAPYTSLEADDIAAGALDGLDVLVTPGGDFPTALRLLGDAGQRALRRWVRGGGRYVGYRGGGAKLPQALGLTTAVLHDPQFDIGGNPVRVKVDTDHPLARGVGSTCWVLFDDDDKIIHHTRGTAPVWFPDGPRDGFYVSGFSLDERRLFGTPAVIDEQARDGRVVLMPSDPFYKGHMEGTGKILWNAIYGPDPVRPAAQRMDDAAYARATERARRAAFAEPSWPMSIRVTVGAGDEGAVRSMLRRFGAEYVVRHADGLARFRVRNVGELSSEEHPWVNDLALQLQRRRVDVRAFHAP